MLLFSSKLLKTNAWRISVILSYIIHTLWKCTDCTLITSWLNADDLLDFSSSVLMFNLFAICSILDGERVVASLFFRLLWTSGMLTAPAILLGMSITLSVADSSYPEIASHGLNIILFASSRDASVITGLFSGCGVFRGILRPLTCRKG